MVSTKLRGGSGKGPKAQSGNKTPVKKDDAAGYNFLPWGDDNLWPQNTWDDIKTNDLAPSVIDWRARAMYGGGLIYGFEYVDDAGNEIFRRFQNKELEAWLLDTSINLYITEASHDHYTYGNIFPKLIKNNGGTKINEIYAEDAQNCRMGRQSESNGWIKEVSVSANYRDSKEPQRKYSAVDSYGPIQKQFEAAPGQFIYPLFRRINGNVAYEIPPYYSIISSKWMDFAKQIPIWKNAFMENASTLRWHIEIHEDYWSKKYKKWAEKTEDEQVDLMRAEVEEFIDQMTGADAAGKGFMTTIMKNPNREKDPISLWNITPLKPGKEGGEWLEDSQEADFHIMRAFGVDPTLIGQTPGAKMGSGSGSDKRVAFNQYVLMCKAHQDKILDPLQQIATFNKWHELARKESSQENAVLRFRFKNYQVATLNTGTETTETTKSN